MLDVKIACAWASVHHLDDVDQVMAETRPDALIVDCLMSGALAALERRATPAAVLVHSALGALVPPGGAFESTLVGPVDRVRAAAGLPQIEGLWTAWEPFVTFSNSIRQLDQCAGDLPRSFGYVGPMNERLATSGWQSPSAPDDARALVIVSFSTGPYWNQTSRNRRSLEALSDRDYRVLVTSGGADLSRRQYSCAPTR